MVYAPRAVRSRSLVPSFVALATVALAGACGSPSGEIPGSTHSPLVHVYDASPDEAAADAGPDADAAREIGALDAAAPVPASPRLVELGYKIDKVYKEPRLRWRQVQTLNWQAVADDMPVLPPEPVVSAKDCPSGMILVEGGLLLDKNGKDDTDGVLDAQDTTCEVWRVPKRICERFSEPRWKAVVATLPRKSMRFCADRYEYPNRHGEFPLVVTTFSESEKYCAKEGKRLCTESEWTLSCEGEEGRPYPYGYSRDATACPLDRPRIEPPEDTFIPRTNGHTARGIDTMWQGERAGAFSRCLSPYGLSDMTGNVDEWTRSTRKWGYKMILKGGHWSYVRGRCRPQTRGHGPLYVNVETGFRCCRDAPAQ